MSDEWDVPLGGIRPQPQMVLARTHVDVAAADVRFVLGDHEITEASAARIWDSIGRDEFPIFEPHKQQMVTVQFSPSGTEQSIEVQQGWLLSTADRSAAVTLLPSTVVVQTQMYKRYSESLASRMAAVLPLFAKSTGAGRVTRLGLRYVNRFRDEDALTPQFWRNLIDLSFGAPLQGPLSDLVVAQQQQLQMKLDSTAWARIQSGLLEEPGQPTRFSFLVDLDVFREATLDYDETAVANQLRQLNRTALALFAHVVAPQYLEGLGPARVAATDGTEVPS
jgi:uncharacterized protein (TIGR04255 family)